MPAIHIKSLPLNPMPDLFGILTGISEDFAKVIRAPSSEVSATWTFLNPMDAQSDWQPTVIVELLVDSAGHDNIDEMLSCIANSIKERVNVEIDDIDLEYRNTVAGHFFFGARRASDYQAQA